MNFRTAISQAVAGGKQFILCRQNVVASVSSTKSIVPFDSIINSDTDTFDVTESTLGSIIDILKPGYYDIYIGAVWVNTSTSSGSSKVYGVIDEDPLPGYMTINASKRFSERISYTNKYVDSMISAVIEKNTGTNPQVNTCVSYILVVEH